MVDYTAEYLRQMARLSRAIRLGDETEVKSRRLCCDELHSKLSKDAERAFEEFMVEEKHRDQMEWEFARKSWKQDAELKAEIERLKYVARPEQTDDPAADDAHPAFLRGVDRARLRGKK